MKRILSTILGSVLALSMATGAFAAIQTPDGNDTLEVKYTVAQKIEVSIPESGDFGTAESKTGTVSLSAGSIITEGEQLTVKVSSTEGEWKLTNGTKSLGYTIKSSEVGSGATEIENNGVVLTVSDSEAADGKSATLTFALKEGEKAKATTAGDYTQQITFTVSVGAI